MKRELIRLKRWNDDSSASLSGFFFFEANIFRQPHPPTKKSLFLVFCSCHKELAAPAEDVGAPVQFLNPKPGNEVEELGLADGTFFAPLTIEGPEEANGKAADTWAWWCLGW